jgi:outer membrane immunogenic protein
MLRCVSFSFCNLEQSMRKILSVAVFAAAFALSGHAFAADIYSSGGLKDGPAVYPGTSWTGFYIGINGGYGAQSADQLKTPDWWFAGVRPEGGFAGGQIGYNWQAFGGNSRLVLGLEADVQLANISDSKTVVYDTYSASFESRLDWFGTVRGRLGYAVNSSALLYFTGGFAFGSVHNSVSDQYDGYLFSKSETATGYVLGGGLEYKWGPAWSIKAEYQYLNLGKNEPVANDGTTYSFYYGGAQVSDDAFHTVRVGLNYHVNRDYEPLK